MIRTILLTGATDGLGLAASKLFVEAGHRLFLHGRNAQKLDLAATRLAAIPGAGEILPVQADLSVFADVEKLADSVKAQCSTLHVLINNAGVYQATDPRADGGLDVRFVVNTLAPYLLTRRLLPLIPATGRVVNLSSAAQSPVNMQAFTAPPSLGDGVAYAQSKLAITMWSKYLADELGVDGPTVIVLNPGSLLGSKMVKALGVEGGDIAIGADAIMRAALEDEFSSASGRYYDNDRHRFADLHPDALNSGKVTQLVRTMDKLLAATG